MAKSKQTQPDYDDYTFGALVRSGMPPMPDSSSVRKNVTQPYTTAGLPGLLVRDMPALNDSNMSAFVLADPRYANFDKNRAVQKNIFVRPGEGAQTIGHEAEHLLAIQGLGHGAMIDDKFDELTGSRELLKKGHGRSFVDRSRNTFVDNALKAAPYLQEKYGLEKNAYFDPKSVKFMQSKGGSVFYEQVASLAALEAQLGVDLTKDPVLRKTLCSHRDVREAYNAITGLRQTRLDSKDLPPYTRLAEPEPAGLKERFMRMLGYANGGSIEGAGRKKLI